MGSNFHTPFTTAVRSRASELNSPLSSIDTAITYLKNVIVHCDGDITYSSSTGVLAWTGTLRIHFNRTDGYATQNTVAAGSITLADNEFAYVTLNEINDTALTVAKAAVSTGSASNFKGNSVLVLAYRNTSSDNLYFVHLPKLFQAKQGSIATKNFWSGTQDEYNALGTYDSNTLYFIIEE